MFNALSVMVGWRYARATTQNRFIRFISASSIIGIALGCAVLILVMSAMNGFERELKDRLLSVVPHIEFTAVELTGIENWSTLAQKITKNEDVIAVAPYIKLNGLIQKGTRLKPLQIRGIDWEAEQAVSDIASYVADKQVIERFKNEQGIILGQGLINELGLVAGENIEVLIPKQTADLKLNAPNVVRLKLLGAFEMGGQLDHGLGYISLPVAAAESGWKQGVQGIRLKINDVFNAPQLARQIGYDLPVYVYISNWTHEYGHLYNDIILVRQVMYIILILVIAVACFNIVSTLVMAVNEKTSDIAILKTMGTYNASIIKIFMVQGLYNGLLGVAYGVVFGCVASVYLTEFMQMIEGLLGTQFLTADVYFVDFLPTELQWIDVVATAIGALLMSLISTIYPAYKATKIDPAQMLGGG
ncbi:lipoprotein-releasing ABC transporter permease subunit LolE [Algibacillus agarilyticus]|uniref:lipoprotein-releasing ABC transporter permease subunit LolE n=1 Tax=Algibacillus agarilyticus TaxID=2234133 RepID=UPI000DD04350|nr:lipoprotein-releasing ABC transporter permease subunit LolE [Algibacillus agarilyticus]